MLIFERRLLDQPIRNLSLDIHEVLEHLIVRLSRKHDFASVQLVQRHGETPRVDHVIVRHAQNCSKKRKATKEII